MSQPSQVRTYVPTESAVFLKTNERFGGLSNMAPGFPLVVNGVRIRTSEALYQSCRFPHMPEVQRMIIGERSPMTAKMRSKPYHRASRPDWDGVRVKIMRWCLRVKLAQNWASFGRLLLSTGDRPIVEKKVRRKDFWGATEQPDGTLVGMNVLGRLLMELREQLKGDEAESLRFIEPLAISEFLLFGQPIEAVQAAPNAEIPGWTPRRPSQADTAATPRIDPQPSLFEQPMISSERATESRQSTASDQAAAEPGRYPAYKAAKVHWLGEIPAHWSEKRAKYFFREIDERSQTSEEELLSVSHTTGVTPRSQKNVTMFKAESYVGHKVARPNDVVINTMWAWMSALGVSKNVGIVSPAYGVYRPLNSDDFLPEYVDYLLRTPMLRWEYICRSTGIRASRLRLYPDEFLDIALPCPPRDEQTRIIAFLRAKDAQVRRLIRSKRRIAELASERLKLATHDAMTSSDAYEARLEVATTLVSRPVRRTEAESFTPVGLYNRGRGLFKKPETPGDELGDSDFFWIEAGDLIVSGQFAWEGAVALADDDAHGCIASHRYPILRGTTGMVDTAYLLAFFRSDYGGLLLDLHSRGAAGRNRPLNVRSLRKEKITIPPLEEQERVKRLVELEASVRRRLRSETDRILEYRERLIADVVTGRLDVRHVEIAAPADDQISDEDDALEEELEADDAEVMEGADADD
ncbi:NADAR domain-containing protein [Rhodobacteraceae bacterium DSL-40]|uniref:NADAR domain-containing protein n=1 Tax=Amaricoccus sp. B4 TaxID=3368557 RepID=UPI000DAC08EC